MTKKITYDIIFNYNRYILHNFLLEEIYVMDYTGLNELREKFLSFFEGKDHLRLPSFPLIPQSDKSLLLINAGMAPLKKYFTGELSPPSKRITTCQKCIRTPDIERVGKTSRHGTYFEMLGNFSFGDYFKREAIAWAWEFCTKTINLPKDKLFISVFVEDDETYDIWTNEIGVSPQKIERLGKEDNFWEHGAGPCGPCSEIYFDRGAEHGCGSPDCKVGCECDRFVEFWNLVFTQFYNDGSNNYTRLKSCNIDTGMGLERLACIVQGADSLFEVDTVRKIIEHAADIAGAEYHTDEKRDVSLRVITDHIRSTTFMIGDGVMPSNEGRGYVLRRLLRRAARHGRILGIDGTFLTELCETVINENKDAYPELLQKHDFIINVIKNEEEGFGRTIDSGLSLLSEMIEKNNDVLSGADAFLLSDTFGFPIDLTKEIISEKGMTVDEEEFERLAAEQRERSRNARRDAGADAWKTAAEVAKGAEKTVFTGYDSLSSQSRITAIITESGQTDFIEGGAEASVALDTSPFYAESGGQAGDTGTITGDDFVFEVTAATKTSDGVFLHHGSVAEGGGLSKGTAVLAAVDAEKREATQRNHTAAHLLQAALRQILGTHVEQAGQMVNNEVVRFDFTHFSALTSAELSDVERLVNEEIIKALPVTCGEMTLDEAKSHGAMALFGEKYGDVVRVVRAGDFSAELCGGTHVPNTGMIGLFKIIGESSVAAGVRRIEGLTGLNALDYLKKTEKIMEDAAKALKITNLRELDRRALGVMTEMKEKDREIERLSEKLAKLKAESMTNSACEFGGIKLITSVLDETSPDSLRSMCDAAKESDDTAVVVVGAPNDKGTANFAAACAPGAIKKGAHAGNIVREVAKRAGGSGGGRPDSAMAGAKDVSKIGEAISAAEEIVKAMLK